MSEKPIASLFPALYSHRLHEIQAEGRAYGYAIAIHGSMQRDLDVLAVPWVDHAWPVDAFVRGLCERLMTEIDRIMDRGYRTGRVHSQPKFQPKRGRCPNCQKRGLTGWRPEPCISVEGKAAVARYCIYCLMPTVKAAADV